MNESATNLARHRRIRRIVFIAIPFIAVVAAGAGVWLMQRPAIAPIPPIPEGVDEPEVRSALEEARGKVAASPRDAAAWGHLGLTFFANRFDRDADQCFAEASRLDPDDARWPYIRGVIASKREPDKTVPLLRQAVAATKPGPEYVSLARLKLAETLLERRELDEANKLFTIEANHPDGNARAVLGLGMVARARGDDAAALKYLTEARSSPYTTIQATIQLAAIARTRGDNKQAEELEKLTTRMADDRPWPDPLMEEVHKLKVGRRARERTIEDLENDHRYDLAAAMYLSQISERPTVAAYCGAAVNYARLEEFDRAVELAREAIRLDSQSSQAHYTLALVLMTRAEKEWTQAPGSTAGKEWFQESINSARRATELKSDHGQAYLFWGVALKYLGESAKAIEPLRKGLACRPDQMALYLSLGEVLTDVGEYAEAESQLENAKRLAPDDPRPTQALERLRAKKGKQ